MYSLHCRGNPALPSLGTGRSLSFLPPYHVLPSNSCL